MTIKSWLNKSVLMLENANLSTARLDAEVLLADELGKDRSWLHTHEESELASKLVSSLDAKLERRIRHEPLAYIRVKQEFYGREFVVTPDTLTPRPETETMLELFFQQIEERRRKKEDNLQIIDIGTGSGCIIITAALELLKISPPAGGLTSKISFVGLDISEPALKIALKNAQRFDADVSLKKFDLNKDSLSSFLSPLSSILVLANLPYVPDNFHINLAASHEPAFAIFGGEDGLDYYRELFRQLTKIENRKSKIVFTESLPPQHEKLAGIAANAGFKLKEIQDFIQVFSKN
jgi:release factor glutamine methyltransferase